MQEFLQYLNIPKDQLFSWIFNLALNIVLSVVIWLFGFWLSKRISLLVSSILKRRKADEGLIMFLRNFSSFVSKVITIILAISQLGVAMTSFFTILGAVGIAFGVAFGGILSNFAGGVLILIIKPFKLNDTINALTVTGEVKEIQMFNTYIRTVDNKTVVLPNGPLINGVITNFTREGKRRVDLVVPVPYQENSLETLSKIKSLIEAHPKVLKDPIPAYYFTEFKEQSGSLNINIWVDTIDFVSVQRELSNAIFPWIQPVPQIS